MQDVELLSLCRNNPNKGMEYIIEQYSGLVYSIIYQKLANLGTREDRKECISDVFMTFYQQLEKIDLDKGSIKAYLSVIGSRKAIDLYRKLNRLACHQVEIGEEKLEYEDTAVNLEQGYINKEEKKMLLEAIDNLGEPDREIFVRKYYLGQKTREIAAALNLVENTVDKKISRGLKKLRFMLGGVTYGETDEILSK